MVCGLLFSPQQSADVVVAGSALNPAGHVAHTEAPLAAYVSTGHTLHVALPEMLFAVPAAHATHGPTFGPVYPVLHEQSLTFVLPTNEFAFCGQLVHAALPFAGLYVAAAQAAQGPSCGPVNPGLHRQFALDPLRAGAALFTGHMLQSGLPSGDHLPAGHSKQLSAPFDPKPAAYSPSEQFEQAVRASCALYLPWLHSAHRSVPLTCANPASQ
jgi:hypothetical protein